jgi:hypothetical protein
MPAPIRITLELTSTGRWRALWGTKLLVTSKQPLLSAARVLLGEGIDPETVLEARHHGSDVVVARTSLGEATRGFPEASLDRPARVRRGGQGHAGGP